MGIPYKWPDLVHEFVRWSESTRFNEDYTHSKSNVNVTNVSFTNIQFDFMLRTETIAYVGVYEIFKQLGAVMAAIAPILRFVSPLMVLFFLKRLSKIVQDSARMNYKL